MSIISEIDKMLFKIKFLQNYKNKFVKSVIFLVASLLIFAPSYTASNILPKIQLDTKSPISPLTLTPCSDINFPGPDFIVGYQPHSVAIGDIDGDGKPDLVVANGDNSISILRNISTRGTLTIGSFAPQVIIPANSPTSVALGDIDGDGKLDLVATVSIIGLNIISVFKNTTVPGIINNSSFAIGVAFPTGNEPSSVAIKDIDGDGKLDLAIANHGSNTVSVLKNTSTKGTIDNNSFAPKVDFSVGIGPSSIAIADLDGDGKPDLAVVNSNSSTVSILRSVNTTGIINSASFAAKVDFITNDFPKSLAIGDIDGDGKLDLVVANLGFLGNGTTVSVLKNQSTKGTIDSSSFAPKVDFTTGTAPVSVAIGDLDGDGKLDLAVNNGSATVTILKNTSANGSISFAANPDLSTGNQPFSVAIGDLDGDSKPDLAVASFGNNTVSVLRNTSIDGFISFATQLAFATDLVPLSTAMADLDGDGKPDLVAANGNKTISVLRNISTNGNTLFANKVDFSAGNAPFSLAVADLDGDGKLDLVVTNQNDNTISILKNTSTPGIINNSSFATKIDFATGNVPLSVAIGDIDGDGKPDLAVTNNSNNTVSLFRNTSTSGTIDNSSFAAKVDFPTGNAPFSVTIGDIDGDGKPDLAVTNFNSSTVSVFRNSSTKGTIDTNSFVAHVDFSVGNVPRSVAIRDLDGDGKADLIVLGNLMVSTLKNTSTPGIINSSSFAPQVNFIAGSSLTSFSTSLAIGDLDNDGKLDLVITNGGSNTVSILRNTASKGSISLASQQIFSTGNAPFSVAIGDLDSDGKLDLAVANASSSTISVLLNTCVAKSSYHNTIYVADTLNNRIQRSINNGVSWQIVGNGAGIGLGQFNAPKAVTADSTDTIIFVADTANNRIQRSINGVWSLIATGGTAINQVNQPSGVSYDEINNKLYIADTANNRILVVTNPTTSPNFALFAGATSGTTIGKVNQPQSMAIDSTGKVYVADTANNRIQVNSNGLSTGWTVLATAGSSIGQVLTPKGIYVDNNGAIWIADTLNNRIQVNMNGVWSVFMSPGTAVGAVNRPEGVVLDLSGNVFIADTGNNRIQSKPANGGNAIVVGTPGLSVGQFNQPSGIR